ncbi:uncharacterized protein [Physcomitrium patens]|uniref:uncharacterized protein n=1 Tax=Physcomitrium patens TaxID=3218 RepID=UPI003CCD9F19
MAVHVCVAGPGRRLIHLIMSLFPQQPGSGLTLSPWNGVCPNLRNAHHRTPLRSLSLSGSPPPRNLRHRFFCTGLAICIISSPRSWTLHHPRYGLSLVAVGSLISGQGLQITHWMDGI